MSAPARRERSTRDALVCLLAPVLLGQGLWAKARTPRLPEASGPRQGSVGQGRPLNLTALGDSIIAGVGVNHSAEALPARLAASLASRLQRQIRWNSQGSNGARTRDLLTWQPASHWREANLLLVSNGLNDVTGLMGLQRWLELKADLFDRLRKVAPSALILQLGLPPLHCFPALPQPLRWALGNRARSFDFALEALVEQRSNCMYLPFRVRPAPDLFAADGYHPGPDGVRQWADALAEKIVLRLPDGSS